MSNWRNYILQHFREPIHRLTLVADPDGLMLEEKLLVAIRRNGFDLLPFEDHIAFRYAYESGYRQHWDEGHDTDLVVILRSPSASLHSLPYDLLQSGRALTFSLPDLFPRLSYPVISELDPVYLQPLYDAYQQYDGPEMGDRASTLFVLKHVFGIVPDLVRTPADLLKLLLSRHARAEVVPVSLDALLLQSLNQNPAFEDWPLAALLRSADDFFAFLQARWPGYLASQQSAETLLKEPGADYVTGESLPFDDPDVRAYVDTFFLEGKLRPVALPASWRLEGWAQVGVEHDPEAVGLRRLTELLELLSEKLPAADAPYRDWTQYAVKWAEAVVLYHRFREKLDEAAASRYRVLHLKIEERFANWMLIRYHTLHSLPFMPKPIMVHQVPNYMAAYRRQHPDARLALVVVDGLALDQWRIIRDVWTEESQPWSMQEGTLFAWVPTLTPISRQATFAGTAPQFFPDSWGTTEREETRWHRFWAEQGTHPASVGYLRNLGVRNPDATESTFQGDEVGLEEEVVALLESAHTRVVGLVLNTVDNIMHGMELSTAGMHQQVRLWLTRHRYLTRLIASLVEESFTVFLTADHGNVSAQGIGRPKEGVLVEKRGQRARIYTGPAFAALAKGQSPTAIEWTNVGLPAQLKVLLAPQLDAFLDVGRHAVCHGGIALEEVIVPFVQISQESTA